MTDDAIEQGLCPKCGEPFEENFRGEQTRCPDCGTVIEDEA
jgi:transcription initiation factor TFIIIB Brf1 subunit/transcription initiation factor TFIIB